MRYLLECVGRKDYCEAATVLYFVNRKYETVTVYKAFWDRLTWDERRQLTKALDRRIEKTNKIWALDN